MTDKQLAKSGGELKQLAWMMGGEVWVAGLKMLSAAELACVGILTSDPDV